MWLILWHYRNRHRLLCRYHTLCSWFGTRKYCKVAWRKCRMLFDWFSNNYLKANPDKCHHLVNTTGNIRISVRNETISNSSNQKLLGIRFNSNFRFDDHVASLCKQASQKLNALTRVAQYMNLAQRSSIIKAFICFQFGYCPLVWMFHNRKINNRVNSLHEGALRVVYRDYNATFFELLSKEKSVTIHQRNLQLLATEIFKTKNELNPKIMEEIFTFKNADYDLRNNTSLKIGQLKNCLLWNRIFN